VGEELLGFEWRFGLKPSSGWRRWLCHLGGRIGVTFRLEHGGRQMLESSSRGLPDHEHGDKSEGL
jgi:hypothetical protein